MQKDLINKELVQISKDLESVQQNVLALRRFVAPAGLQGRRWCCGCPCPLTTYEYDGYYQGRVDSFGGATGGANGGCSSGATRFTTGCDVSEAAGPVRHFSRDEETLYHKKYDAVVALQP